MDRVHWGNEREWRAREESNLRPSGFRRRRTLSSFAASEARGKYLLQFFTSFSRFEPSLPPHRFSARGKLLLVDKNPGSSSFGRFGDAGIVLPDPLSDVRRKANVVSVGCFAAKNVDEEHGIKSGAPERSRTSDLLVRSQTLYPAELRARRSANAVKIDYDMPPRSSTTRIALNERQRGQSATTIVGAASENRAIQFRLS